MLLYKSCPKCRGDLSVERDIYGGQPDLRCLQCGYTARPDERAALLARAARSGPAPMVRERRAS